MLNFIRAHRYTLTFLLIATGIIVFVPNDLLPGVAVLFILGVTGFTLWVSRPTPPTSKDE